MAEKELKRAKYSKNRGIEKNTFAILESILSEKFVATQFTGGDDCFPNIDGYIHILNANGNEEMMGQTLMTQVKTVGYKGKNNTPYITCRPGLLAYALDSLNPILVIGVDIDERVAYWLYLSPESVNRYRNEREKIPEETITLDIPKKNVLKEGKGDCAKEWKRICLHHQNKSNDKQATFFKRYIEESFHSEESIQIEQLEMLNCFMFYRTTDGKYPLVDTVLGLSKVIYTSSSSVKCTYIKLLEQIVCHKTFETFEVLVNLLGDKDDEVQHWVQKILKDISKYNLHTLNSFGYRPQRGILDFLRKHWEVLPSEIVQEVCQNLLSPDFEGTTQKDVKTLVFHRGALEPTAYLKEIRKDTIVLLFQCIEKTSDLSDKVNLIATLGKALRFSGSKFTDDDFHDSSSNMVTDNSQFIVSKYKKLIVEGGKLSSDFPVVCKVEEQLAFLSKHNHQVRGVKSLLTTIRKDKGDYALYRLMFGNTMWLYMDLDWKIVEEENKKKLNEILKDIKVSNSKKWYNKFKKITNLSKGIENIDQRTFQTFLEDLASQKPKVADIFISSSSDRNSEFYSFIGSLLFRLHQGSPQLWDKQVKLLSENNLKEPVSGLLRSFQAHNQSHKRVDVPKKIRSIDIEIVLEIVYQKNRFAFLKGTSLDLRLEYQIFETLCFLSFKSSEIRKALIYKIQSCPELHTFYSSQLKFALSANWTKLDAWKHEEVKIFADMMVEIKNLNYSDQNLLYEIGQFDFPLMMSVFKRRMERDITNEYTALPIKFNDELVTFISGHSDNKSIFKALIEGSEQRNRALYFHHLRTFFENIRGTSLKEIFDECIESGNKQKISVAIDIFLSSNPVDILLCFEIVEKIDDEDILRRVNERIRGPLGSLSGGYYDNLDGNALRGIENQVQKIKQETKSRKIEDFCNNLLQDLKKDIDISDEENRKRIEKEKKEFEDSEDTI